MAVVTQLITYPLKGARGTAAPEMAIGDRGPEGDRRWMVVDPDGNLVTQREAARLCLIGATAGADGLRLEAAGMSPLDVPTPGTEAPAMEVRVWSDRCPARVASPDAHQWLGDFLDRPVRLVYMPDSTRRRTDADYDPVGAWVSFADGYPALLTNEESLSSLNARLEIPVPMARFRPNIVVTGAPPFDEDRWRRFRIGPVRFDGVKPCARCQVPTIDQNTAQAGKEPLKTLARFRKRGSAVLFGMNVVHRGAGVLRVGDTVEVETVGPPAIPGGGVAGMAGT